MRYSRLFGKTVRDKPRNADSESHQLLLRGGFVRPASGGGFLLLPLGQRVMEKVQAIVAEEIEQCGASVLGFPGGRQSANSDLCRSLRLRRREASSDYAFAEHHGAALAPLAGSLALSYRDLPLLAAGTRWANREEAHPNWGLLAAPEFLFHSVYGFGAGDLATLECLSNIGNSYMRALQRMQVKVWTMRSLSHASTMEIAIETQLAARPTLVCSHCGYAEAAELAESRVPEWPQQPNPGVAAAVYGPGLIQVGPLSQFLGIPVHQTTKTMLFEVQGQVIAACVAGIYGVSEAKLMRLFGGHSLSLAAPEVVKELTNSEVGYAGPVGLPPQVQVIWDLSTEHRNNFEAGANRTDHHCINLNFGRDLPCPAQFFDIRIARPGERCTKCEEGRLEARAAIVLGNLSTVGDLYAELLGAKFLAVDKTTHPLPVNCSGLDLSALLAAVVEQHHDGRGIIWPDSVAPFAAQLVSLPTAEAAAESLYQRLRGAGVDVLWDDRTESAGVKFGDADLIGNPVRLVMSRRTGDKIEWKARGAEQVDLVEVEEAVERLRLD